MLIRYESADIALPLLPHPMRIQIRCARTDVLNTWAARALHYQALEYGYPMEAGYLAGLPRPTPAH